MGGRSNEPRLADGDVGPRAPARRSPAAVEYGLVFCELPPRDLPPRRTARPRPNATADEAPKRGGGPASATAVKRITETSAAYNRRRRKAIARPDEIWLPYVSAEPARRHLAALSAGGVGLETVARLSGVSHGALSKIVYGQPGRGTPPSRRVRPHTLEAILAVGVNDAGGCQRVDAAATWQLIDELVAMGYGRGQLARALGSQAAVAKLQIGRRRVLASTARAVELVHRSLLGRSPQ